MRDAVYKATDVHEAKYGMARGMMNRVGLYDELVPQLQGYDKILTANEHKRIEGEAQKLIDGLRMDPKAAAAFKAWPQPKQDEWNQALEAWNKRRDANTPQPTGPDAEKRAALEKSWREAPDKLGELARAAQKDPSKVFDYTKAWDDAEKTRRELYPKEDPRTDWLQPKETALRDAKWSGKLNPADQTKAEDQHKTADYDLAKARIRELDAETKSRGYSSDSTDKLRASLEDKVRAYEGKMPDARYNVEKKLLQQERDEYQKKIDALTPKGGAGGTGEGREPTAYEKEQAQDRAERIEALKKKQADVDKKVGDLERDHKQTVDEVLKQKLEKSDQERAAKLKTLEGDRAKTAADLEAAKKDPSKAAEAARLEKDLQAIDKKVGAAKTEAGEAKEKDVRKARQDFYDRTVEPLWPRAQELKKQLSAADTDGLKKDLDKVGGDLASDQRRLADLQKQLSDIRAGRLTQYVGDKKVADRDFEKDTLDRIGRYETSIKELQAKYDQKKVDYTRGEANRLGVRADLEHQYLRINAGERAVDAFGKPEPSRDNPFGVSDELQKRLKSDDPSTRREALAEFTQQVRNGLRPEERKEMDRLADKFGIKGPFDARILEQARRVEGYQNDAAKMRREADELAKKLGLAPPFKETPKELKTPAEDRLAGSAPPRPGKAEPPAVIYRGGRGGTATPATPAPKNEQLEGDLARAGRIDPALLPPERKVIPAKDDKAPPQGGKGGIGGPEAQPEQPAGQVKLSPENQKIMERQMVEITKFGREVYEDFLKFQKKLGGPPTGPIQQKIIDLPDKPADKAGDKKPGGPAKPGEDTKLPQGAEDALMLAHRFNYGLVMQGLGTLHGLSKFITQPEEIAKGLAHMAKNPGETGKNIWKSIKDSWEKDPVEFGGRATFEIGSLFLGPGGKGGTAGKGLAKAEEAAGLAAKVAPKAEEAAGLAAKVAPKAEEAANLAAKTAPKAEEAANLAAKTAKAAPKAEEAANLAAKTAPKAEEAAKLSAKAENVLGREFGEMQKAVGAGKKADVEKLSAALQKEAGLGKEAADKLARNAAQDALERGAATRLAEQQAAAAKPLTQQEIAKTAREMAEKSGLPAKEAAEFADQLAAKAGFRDWVASQMSPNKWSPELAREHFLATAPKGAAKEIEKLSAAELRALYPEGGAIPHNLRGVGEVDGFGAFAKTSPKEARMLADANGVFGGVPAEMRRVVADEIAAARQAAGGKLTPAAEEAAKVRGLQKAAKEIEDAMPTIKQHPTDPRYNIVERKPGSPDWIPEINLRPSKQLDHNGAFHQQAAVQGRLTNGERWVATGVPDYHLMNPSQLSVGGKPLTSMDGVMVFSGHGGRGGFDISTKEAAKMSAEQILAAQKQGKTIDKVVLDACHQRDRRWFMGGSNAQAFERELNAELAKAGGPKVTVLAAERGGPTFGNGQRSWLPTVHRGNDGKLTMGTKWSPATYTPAADGARFYMTKTEAAAAALGAAEVGVGGYYLYRALTDDR